MVVEFNSRAILINATPSLFITGSVHMPRIHPSLWKQIADAAIEHGMVRGAGLGVVWCSRQLRVWERRVKFGMTYVCACDC